jgi:excisionase family DNA binding protein
VTTAPLMRLSFAERLELRARIDAARRAVIDRQECVSFTRFVLRDACAPERLAVQAAKRGYAPELVDACLTELGAVLSPDGRLRLPAPDPEIAPDPRAGERVPRPTSRRVHEVPADDDDAHRFSVSEAAELLGIRAPLVYSWISKGWLPASKTASGLRRVHADDLEKLMREREGRA